MLRAPAVPAGKRTIDDGAYGLCNPWFEHSSAQRQIKAPLLLLPAAFTSDPAPRDSAGTTLAVHLVRRRVHAGRETPAWTSGEVAAAGLSHAPST